MLSFSTRETHAVLCILTEAQSIRHLTFTPQPSRPATTHTHGLRTNLGYLEKERNHVSQQTYIHMESFDLIKRQPPGYFLQRMQVCPTYLHDENQEHTSDK